MRYLTTIEVSIEVEAESRDEAQDQALALFASEVAATNIKDFELSDWVSVWVDTDDEMFGGYWIDE